MKKNNFNVSDLLNESSESNLCLGISCEGLSIIGGTSPTDLHIFALDLGLNISSKRDQYLDHDISSHGKVSYITKGSKKNQIAGLIEHISSAYPVDYFNYKEMSVSFASRENLSNVSVVKPTKLAIVDATSGSYINDNSSPKEVIDLLQDCKKLSEKNECAVIVLLELERLSLKKIPYYEQTFNIKGIEGMASAILELRPDPYLTDSMHLCLIKSADVNEVPGTCLKLKRSSSGVLYATMERFPFHYLRFDNK